MNKLKLIKIVVFILTFLLIFGLLSVLGLLFQKNKKVSFVTEKEISLNEPYGSTITGSELNDNLLYLTVKQGGEADRIIIFDPSQGKIISKINLY